MQTPNIYASLRVCGQGIPDIQKKHKLLTCTHTSVSASINKEIDMFKVA